MNFDTFLLYFYRSEKPPELRLGQYFMNELYRVNQDIYHTIPADLDPYYNDKLLNQCINWVSDRWVDDDDDETELIHRAVRNGADLDSL